MQNRRSLESSGATKENASPRVSSERPGGEVRGRSPYWLLTTDYWLLTATARQA